MTVMPQPEQRRGPIVGRPSARQSAPVEGARLSTQRRTEGYLDLITGLDASGGVAAVDTAAVRDRLAAEHAAVRASLPIGIVAHCYLGGTYQVHTLTWDAERIITHYHRGESLPGGLERARVWAESTAYLAVEVYPEHALCIRHDGTVIKVEN